MNEKTRKELLKIVKNNYSNIAEEFSESRAKPVWPELARLIKEVLPEEDRKLSLLDVGCGNGRLLSVLPTDKIDYLGTDNCSELLYLASKEYPERKFLEADILDLSSVNGVNFDIVCAIAVLHHIPSRKLRLDALKQLKNKLKPGGLLIMTNWNMWPEKKYRHLIWKFFLLGGLLKKHHMEFGDILFDWKGSGKNSGSQRYYHAFTVKELEQLAKNANLKVIRLYKDNYNYYLVAKK